MSKAKASTRQLKTAGRAISDRTVNCLIVALIALLAIGIPVVAVTYYLDRHVDAGPSIAQRAMENAEKAVRDNPNLISARLALASAYAAGKRPADAVSQFGIVLDSESGNRAALLGRADANRELGNLDAASGDYEALIDIAKDEEMAPVDKSLEAAYYGLGAIQLEQDKARDAATNLANALVIDQTDADALDLLGQALIKVGDNPNAIAALRDAVALVPTGWCDPYEHLASAYAAAGDADGVAYANGMVAECENRPDDAIAALEPLVSSAYGRDALVGLGLVAEQRGDANAAADYYRQVYDRDPSDFAAITGLARVGGTVPSPSATPAGAGE